MSVCIFIAVLLVRCASLPFVLVEVSPAEGICHACVMSWMPLLDAVAVMSWTPLLDAVAVLCCCDLFVSVMLRGIFLARLKFIFSILTLVGCHGRHCLMALLCFAVVIYSSLSCCVVFFRHN
jgi:hypothetical protein